ITLEDALTRVRHTSYGSQPDCGGGTPSRSSFIAVNSSLAAGDVRCAAASPAAFRFIFLRSCFCSQGPGTSVTIHAPSPFRGATWGTNFMSFRSQKRLTKCLKLHDDAMDYVT